MSKFTTKFLLPALFLIVFAPISYAKDPTLNFEVTSGVVITTQARCAINPCKPVSSSIKGDFSAIINESTILFPSSSLQTSPNVDFNLPTDPELDEGGTTRTVEFYFNDEQLTIKGTINSLAFDGPLQEYKLVAKLVDTLAGFDPKNFFTARPDFRKCASPMCGGYFVKSVNVPLTKCVDGKLRAECYVAAVEFGGSVLSGAESLANNTPYLLQGSIVATPYPQAGRYGVFHAKRAYRSASTKTATGSFYGIENNGIMCITSPCFSYDEFLLNSTKERRLSGVDLEQTGASAKDVALAQTLLAEKEVLPAAGQNIQTQEFAGPGLKFVASAFYLPIKTEKQVCGAGYEYYKDACRTPFGCEAPQLQLTTIGGAPLVDPVTGRLVASTSESCVDKCSAPAVSNGPARCTLALP